MRHSVYIFGKILTDSFFFLQNNKNHFVFHLNVEHEAVSIGDSFLDNNTDENRHSSGESQHAKNGCDHSKKKLKMVNILYIVILEYIPRINNF